MEQIKPEATPQKSLKDFFGKKKEKLDERRDEIKQVISQERMKVNKFGVTLVKALYAVLIPLIIGLVLFVVLMAGQMTKEIYETENQASINVFDTAVENTSMQINNMVLRYSNDQNIIAKMVAGNGTAIEQSIGGEIRGTGYYAIFYDATGNVIASAGTLPADVSLKLSEGETENSDYFSDTAMALSYRYYKAVVDTTRTTGYIQIGCSLGDTRLVDSIKAQMSSEVTVFSGDTRIATTIVGQDGARVTGTKMDAAIAQKVITQGEQANGEGVIVNERMIYTYEPIKNK